MIFYRSFLREVGEYDPSDIPRMARQSWERLNLLRETAATGSYAPEFARQVEALEQASVLPSARTGYDVHEVCYSLQRASIEAERINYAHLSGRPAEGEIQDAYFHGCRNFFNNPDPFLHSDNINRSYLPEIVKPSTKRTDLDATVARYLQLREEQLKFEGRKTIKLVEFRGFFKRLKEMLGNKALEEITRIDARKIHKYLIRFPKQFAERHGKQGKSLLEVLESGEDYPRIGPAQAKKMFDTYKSFFSWCVQQDVLPVSPFEGLNLEGKTHTPDDRDSLSKDQLFAIFNSPIYTGRAASGHAPWKKPKHGDGVVIRDVNFWMPLVGLFSGMRAGEILSLTMADLRQDEGVYYFDVNRDEEGKSLKTADSRRKVPVHPELIKCGLIDYWQARVTGAILPLTSKT